MVVDVSISIIINMVIIILSLSSSSITSIIPPGHHANLERSGEIPA
jgi:hypothetical protein